MKEERCFPLPNPILVFQGDTGPQGFPGTPGEVGPKGEKVQCADQSMAPFLSQLLTEGGDHVSSV